MELLQLQAEKYRNITSCDISFSPGVNLLYGKNAQGKTNALECIYLFARGRSFRGSTEGELVEFGEQGFRATVNFRDREREQTLSYAFFGREKQRCRNGVRVSRAADMLGHFRAVFFCPEHLQMVKGGPGERREFLNVAIAQLYPTYITQYAKYTRALEQRNFLLRAAQKSGYLPEEELLAWSISLADTAVEIHCKRRAYVHTLQPYVASLHDALSHGKEEVRLTFLSDVEEEGEECSVEELTARYRLLFTENTKRERAAGCTLYGVQREDVEVLINGISARAFGSQGQQRSAVLALKLAEGEVCREVTGEYPVFLFDDVLSELDEERRSFLLQDAGNAEKQLILTACEPGALAETDARCIRVEGGVYVPTHR